MIKIHWNWNAYVISNQYLELVYTNLYAFGKYKVKGIMDNKMCGRSAVVS